MGVKQQNFDKTVENGFKNLPVDKETLFEDDTETVVFGLRLHKKRKEILQKIFRSKGMDLSTGIRFIVYEWLKEHYK